MRQLSDLSQLWQHYFQQVSAIQGVDAWTIAFAAQDKQQLFITLANPFEEAVEELVIESVRPNDTLTFLTHYKQRLIEQLPNRFGFFRPEVNRVLAEYPNWAEFAGVWLPQEPQLMQRNLPLLFDFPSPAEYRAMQLKDADYAGYRRLLVVVFQYRKQQFQKFFVKDIDDAGFMDIKRSVQQQFNRALPALIAPNEAVHA